MLSIYTYYLLVQGRLIVTSYIMSLVRLRNWNCSTILRKQIYKQEYIDWTENNQILTISRSNISKLQIFLKNRFHSNWRSYLVLTSGQKPKKSLDRFWEKYQSVWFWANLETLSRISPIQEFFSKIRLCGISTFIVP